MAQSPRTFDSLTGLRFVLALWIAVFHLGDMYDHGGFGSWPIMKAGVARVDVFFVLSGFVLTHIYWARTDARFDFAAFLQARFARLMPLHLLALGILLGLVMGARLIGQGEQTAQFTLTGLLANVALVQAWGVPGAGHWNFPAWTISAEFTGYLMFPLFLMLATCMRNRPGLFLAGAVAGVLALDLSFRALFDRTLSQSTMDLGALRGASVILVGVAARVVFEKLRLSARAALALAGAGAGIAGTAAFMEISTAMVALGGAMFVAGLAARDACGAPTGLDNPAMQRLGAWSYGIFILHVPLYMAMRHLAEVAGIEFVINLVSVGVMVGMVVVAAAVAHHAVEEPARRLLRRGLAPSPA